MENSTGNANEAAQSGLRPGHPCGVPPDKPAPPPAQMAGLRTGLFTRARRQPRDALRTAKATRAHRKAIEAFFCRSAGSGKGNRLKRAYGASWSFLRTLKLSCGRMPMAQRHGRRDTPPPTPADGRRAGERRLQRLPPIPPPFPPAGRERVALCRQGCSRRGASLPCLLPAGERWAAPAASRGRVLALRAAGRTNPLTRHPLKNRVQGVA